MHPIATGLAGAALLGGEPPLSPETIGRAPSNFDAPVPVIPLEELVARNGATPAPAVPAPDPNAPPPPPAQAVAAAAAPVPGAAPLPTAAPVPAAERRRLVVRLVGGEEVEADTFDSLEDAVEGAHALVAELSGAEADGSWPAVAGRHLRPAAILSVDVLRVD